MNGSPYSRVALKRGGWHFLTGKIATASLTFFILLLLVRQLPLAEYAAYVTFIAAIELTYALAGLGLPWLATRYLPEFRLNASGRQLQALATRLLCILVVLLALSACILAAGLDIYLRFADLIAYRNAAQLILIFFVVEYTCRFVRENLLGPLMRQGLVRFSQVSKQLTFAILLFVQVSAGEIGLLSVIISELTASGIGLVVSIVGLFIHLQSIQQQKSKPGWTSPSAQEMSHTAIYMYIAQLFTLPYSPQALLLLVQRLLSADAVALFGFLYSLYLQILNNLPATLLFSLVQPKLVASQVGSGISELCRNANLAGKLSLFVLMPFVTIAAAVGEEFVRLASGERFSSSGHLFFGMMLALVPFSQRRLLETVAVSAGFSGLCTLAALSGLTVLPLIYLLVDFNWGLWAPVIGLTLGYIFFNLIVQVVLIQRTEYRPDFFGSFKLLIAAGVGSISAFAFSEVLPNLPGLFLCASISIITYLVAAWLLKPFSADERTRLNALFSRRLFIW